MNFLDNFWSYCFKLGMMASHAFAAALYASIFLLLLYTVAMTTWHLLA